MAMEERGGVSAAIEFQDRFTEPTARALDAISRLQNAIERFRGDLNNVTKGMQRLASGLDAMAKASSAMANAAPAFARAETDAGGIVNKMPAALEKAETAFGKMPEQAANIAASMADATKSADVASKARLRVPTVGGSGGRAPRVPGLLTGWPWPPREKLPFSPTTTSEPGGPFSAAIGRATEAHFKWTIASLIAHQAVGGVMEFLGSGGRILDIQASVAQMGLTKPQIAKAAIVSEQLATQIPGATPSEALAGFMELRSVPGTHAEAMATLPAFLKDITALLGCGPGGEGDTLKLIKALDVPGAFKNAQGQLNPAKLQQPLHIMVAAMIALQGLVTPAMMLRFVQMAGPGIQNANIADVLRGYVELLIGIGNRSGRGTGMVPLAQIQRFGAAGGLFDQALGSDPSNVLMTTGWTANVQNVTTALETFVQVLAKPDAEKSVHVLQGNLPNLKVPAHSPFRHFGSVPSGSDTGWPPAAVHEDSTYTTNVTINAPLNVHIEGSMLGADYATLDFYMQGWIRQHSQAIGDAVAAQQRHRKRTTFLDPAHATH